MTAPSLRVLLLLGFLALAGLPLLLGGLLAWRSYEASVVELQARQKDLAERLAVELESFFRGVEDHLRGVDLSQDFARLEPAEQGRQLGLLMARHRDFRELAVLDAAGRERARISATEPVFADDLRARGEADEFRVPAASGRTYSGPIHYDGETGEPLMALSVPLADPASGAVTAVLAGELRVRRLWDLAARWRLAAGQSLVVVDDGRRIIAHPNPSVVLRETRLPYAPVVGLGTGPDGEQAYLATREVRVGQQPFTIVAAYAVRQALVPARHAMTTIALGALAALAMVLALAWFVVRRVLIPVAAVAAAARAVRDGDLARRVEVPRDDEIGALAASFNAMTAELEAAMERQRRAMAEIEDLYNQAPCGYHSLGPDGTYLRINDTELAWLGYRREEIVGQRKFLDLVTAEGRQLFATEFPHFKERGWIRDLEFDMVRKDGSLLPALISATAVRDAEGRLLMSRSTLYDITDRRRAEQALRRSQAQLAQAQRIAHLGYWEWDVAGGRQDWSDESYRIFGFEPGAVVPSYELFMELLVPEERERLLGKVREALEQDIHYDCDYRIRRPDGEERYVLGQAEVVRDADGRPLRMVGINLDITERKRAEEAVRQLNQDLERRVTERTAALEESNKELEAFAYSVSHDLRVPLRAIDGFSRIVLEDYGLRLDDEGRRLLNVVRDNTVRMAQLIDDILAFSRTGRQQMAAVAVDVERLAHEVADELLAGVAGRRIRLDVAALPAAWGDRALLRQVLMNLLSNAIKFTQGRDEAIIEVGGETADGETRYWVRDNGAGFDEQYADKLFGVFQRLHSLQEFEGTGIGLAIVKRIVTRHGGRVWAEGRVGEGARFHFALPTKET